jgi:hypothetical protein
MPHFLGVKLSYLSQKAYKNLFFISLGFRREVSDAEKAV